MATYKYTKLNRRGFEVVLPTSVYNELRNNNICVGLAMRNGSKTVQLSCGTKYMGTLKEAMGVKGFKNGNPCDFHVSNLIEVDE